MVAFFNELGNLITLNVVSKALEDDTKGVEITIEGPNSTLTAYITMWEARQLFNELANTVRITCPFAEERNPFESNYCAEYSQWRD